jgi:hypothetical protein
VRWCSIDVCSGVSISQRIQSNSCTIICSHSGGFESIVSRLQVGFSARSLLPMLRSFLDISTHMLLPPTSSPCFYLAISPLRRFQPTISLRPPQFIMPPNACLFASPNVPSREQTALALAILRTKPHDISARGMSHVCAGFLSLTLPDYILQLREHCKTGPPAYNAVETEHYLDLVGYWQDQCRRSQEECDRLRSINIRLERSNHLLSQRTGTTPDERPSTANTATKRKAPASSSRAPKRGKAVSVEQSVAQTQEGIESDFDFLEELGDGI